MSAADRKAEIELKKAKLRALREDKLRREENRRQALSGNNSGAGSTADVHVDPDAILKILGIEPLQEPAALQPNAQTVDGHASPNILGLRTSHARRKKLQVCQVAEFDIKPLASETYEKEIQTAEAEPDEKVLTYDDTPTDTDRMPIGSFDEPTERVDTKMLKSVHGEIPRQLTTSNKAELEEPACKYFFLLKKRIFGCCCCWCCCCCVGTFVSRVQQRYVYRSPPLSKKQPCLL
ncbi:unnamed protein product [Dibothriocephalus latus]|uniref:Uncharacterized protein n=1 Tax=Dibothriocephalus latus TaxID=60516 RepID=A0A3P7LQF4_DIBLA|nr:unnamed protein product [Dibothriocephalus latus]